MTAKFSPGDQVQCTVGGGPHDGKRGRIGVVVVLTENEPAYPVTFFDGTTAVVLETALRLVR